MITLCEVGPRDGLQNEDKHVSTEHKVKLIEQLINSGVTKIEAVSFVHPKVVPQMADAEQVLAGIGNQQKIEIAGLVLNRGGFKRAIQTQIDRVHIAAATSDTFNIKNAKKSVQDGVNELSEVTSDAVGSNYPVTAILATSFGCPYEGKVDPNTVFQAVESFLESGADEIVLADTTGMANPYQVQDMIGSFRRSFGKDIPLGLHFHNTRGLGLANVLAGYEAGVRRFDASIGGLGGCPFAPKAVGNVCSEDMIHMFDEMGVETGVNLEKMIQTSQQLEKWIEKTLEGLVMKAGAASVNGGKGECN
ncbi:hydroxymethylglutaryl-CoA lyase [Salicibibacter cibarius]|uniref:Hydroxymethylglutaryl-CoA lyase n=1 Tax=Salicibibacter cibarius TaxID=2743000 RepID=A0A7T6Z3P7_9BACI|nr:hydroxymethylglutaryl-CoA lyase [Salicibibacter cibarius]QQK76453.1 hydroxymethylglutaryl-CoA lyase [Salicibibacter cibarius]